MGRRISIPVPSLPKPRGFGYEGSPLHFSKKPLIWSLAIWWTIPVIFALVKGFMLFKPGTGTFHNGLFLFLERNIWAVDGGWLGLSNVAWIYVAVASLATAAAIVLSDTGNDNEAGKLSTIEGTAIGLNLVLFAVGVFGIFPGSLHGERDWAREITQSVTIRVNDVERYPSSLSLLYDQRSVKREVLAVNPTTNKPERIRFGDLATVAQGVIPADLWKWEERNSSLSGAMKWLNDKTPTGQGLDTWDATFTYVYGHDNTISNKVRSPWVPSDADTSRWSVVIDGSGRTVPAKGAAEWRAGLNTPHVCAFDDPKKDGKYKFTRAFNGDGINSLRNVIGKEFPGLFFNDQDVSGYCDENDNPVYTISMLRNAGAGYGTTPKPACLLVLKGSPSGFPDMNCYDNVQPGQYPVPVYPMSIVQQQRDSIDWAAGRGNKEGASFGYEPSSYASQASNTADYVLRRTDDGSIRAVTPSKYNNTKSQRYVAYQEVRVDSLTSGQYNPMDAYVMEDNDQAVNPAVFDTDARIYMGWVFKNNNLSEYLPITFFGDGGSIQEFVPLTTDVFRGYGVDGKGATRFYIDMSASNKTNPIVTILNITVSAPVVRIEVPKEVRQIGNGDTLKPQVTITCDGKPSGQITAEAARQCMQAYLDELVRLGTK